jgi:deoxyhypusine synthase
VADQKLQRRYLARPPVQPMDLRPGMSVEDLVSVYRKAGAFNGGRLAEGCDLFGRMIDENCTIGLTVTGAMSPAGVGGAFRALIEAGFVDFIVSTGANLYHDLHFALKLPVHQGDFRADDRELFRAGIERIYDVFITEDSLLSTDKFVYDVAQAWKFEGSTSTARLHHLLGTVAREKSPRPELSWVCKAAEYDVPIYTSSPGDSSIGMNIAALKLRGRNLTIDPDLDVLETTAIVYSAEKNGVVILGGGSPKNFYLQTQPTLWQILDLNRGGHEYVLQITTDAPHWGGLSGATPSEAISWGKVQPEMEKNHVVVYADSSIAAPILFSYALSTRKPRTPKRLFKKLDAMMQDLRGAEKKRAAKEAAKK